MPQTEPSNLRWSWLEIDQAALRGNTRAFKDAIGDRARLMAVVKANAYGHGAVPCAKIMLTAGAEELAVATVAEGIELREAGIEAPILVLSEPPMESIDTLIRYDIMPAVQSYDFALAFGERAAAFDRVGRYHLAIDSGMTRAGVDPEDVVELRGAIDFHRGLECAGTFTHFATADSAEQWDFEQQFKRFSAAVQSIHDAGLDCGLVHCDNTAAALMRKETHLDMCRVGIGLYGLHPSDVTEPRMELEPVMSVHARVVRAVLPPVGSGVSYGFNYRVPKQNIQIATIPIGYADGLSRELSARIEFLVGGRRVKQVGSICMDACMFAVDINTVRGVTPPPVTQGDLVTVIGADGDDRITLEDHAAIRGTINYEVACDFGMRLEHVYV